MIGRFTLGVVAAVAFCGCGDSKSSTGGSTGVDCQAMANLFAAVPNCKLEFPVKRCKQALASPCGKEYTVAMTCWKGATLGCDNGNEITAPACKAQNDAVGVCMTKTYDGGEMPE